MDPVTQGRSSGRAVLPSSALATPAPRISATSVTSAAAPMAPAPTRIATFSPAFSTSAAVRSDASAGTGTVSAKPTPEKVDPCSRGGISIGSFCRSLGRITQVTRRSALAIRQARSIRCGTCSGRVAVATKAPATSLNSDCRSRSCW